MKATSKRNLSETFEGSQGDTIEFINIIKTKIYR